MSARPWYRRYPADFIAGTLCLSLEEKGAYSVIIDLIYDRGCPVPDEPRYIAGVCGCSVRKWNAIRRRLLDLGKITVADGRISNRRAGFELENGKLSRDNIDENAPKIENNSEIISDNSEIIPDNSEINEATLSKINGLAHTPRARPRVGARAHPLPAFQKLEEVEAKTLLPKEDNPEAPRSTPRAAGGGSMPSHAARRQDLNSGWLEGLCRQAAGLENEGSPSLCDLSPIAAMLDRGFDLDRDVLPVLRAKAAAGKRGRSWRFYAPAIEESHHRNAGVPIPIRAPPPTQVFVPIDTPEWQAWQALRRTPQITSDEHKRNGWWFPSQWPQPEAATA